MWLRAVSGLILSSAMVFNLGCTGEKAKELLDTAEFEERQMNLPHATQLCEDVIRLYPTSKEAETSQARLASLSHGQEVVGSATRE